MSRWILAFDGGCGGCRSVSDHVRSVVSETLLELRDLTEPEMVELRRQAFGEYSPWLPTLIAVDGDQVRAWTGTALSVRLARLLGPAQSLHVVRALSREEAVVGTDRRRFLKAIPGVAAGGVLLSGGTAFADTTQGSGPADLDVKQIHGAKATATLEMVASDRSVIDLGRRLGIDPTETVADGVVERLPQGVKGVNAQRYVSVVWVNNSQRAVRTSHLVSADGAIDSNIFMLTKTGSEPTVHYGELGGRTETLTESQAASTQFSTTPAYQSYLDCVARCLGISQALLAAILAGCGLACVITVGEHA